MQSQTNTPPYLWKVKDHTYKITPVADYQITGLVVAEYDSQNWLDITHKQDPAQTRDLCIIWGQNLQNGVYRYLKYSHGEFSCTVIDRHTGPEKFNPIQISNNHLIPTTEKLRSAIKKARIGDQISITGQLVSYEILNPQGHIIGGRGTSTTRNDMGSQSCETIAVSDFQVLKKPDFPYHTLKTILAYSLNIAFIIIVLLFFSTPV